MTQDISSKFGNEVARTVNEFFAERDELRRKPASSYEIPEYASPKTRRELVGQARAEDERQLRARAKERIEATLARYPEDVERKRQKLRQEIVGPLADASPDLIARLAMSFAADLADMLEAALMTKNEELTNALFVESVRRDLPDLRWRIAEEVGGVYAEWESLPKSREDAEAKVGQQRHLALQQLGG